MKLYHNCEHCGNVTSYESIKGARAGPRGPRVVSKDADLKERKSIYNKRYHEKRKVNSSEPAPP